jgi:hypothetical protein
MFFVILNEVKHLAEKPGTPAALGRAFRAIYKPRRRMTRLSE